MCLTENGQGLFRNLPVHLDLTQLFLKLANPLLFLGQGFLSGYWKGKLSRGPRFLWPALEQGQLNLLLVNNVRIRSARLLAQFSNITLKF